MRRRSEPGAVVGRQPIVLVTAAGWQSLCCGAGGRAERRYSRAAETGSLPLWPPGALESPRRSLRRPGRAPCCYPTCQLSARASGVLVARRVCSPSRCSSIRTEPQRAWRSLSVSVGLVRLEQVWKRVHGYASGITRDIVSSTRRDTVPALLCRPCSESVELSASRLQAAPSRAALNL